MIENIIMSCLNNSFDYNVKLVGLLPLGFDFLKDENIGVRFQTHKLKKIKKPSEDHHDGQVIVSDAQHLHNYSTAVAETKIIHHNTTPTTASNETDVSCEEDEVISLPMTDSKVVNDEGDQDDEVATLVDELGQKLKVEDGQGNEVRENEKVNKEAVAYDEEPCESEIDDKIMNEDHSAKFLYKCFSNIDGQKLDFLSYRLPLMFLAINTDPYFFKVNKIRFKPYGCEKEMEFIQIKWPIQLDELYESPYDRFSTKGWSGPMFNKWATKESNSEKASSHEESAPLDCSSKARSSSHGDDTMGETIDSDNSSSYCTYHRAYIQAEIKPKSQRDGHGFSNSTRGFNILITALVGGVWELEKDPENYTCKHLAEMRTVKEESLRETRSTRYQNNQSFFYKRVRMLSNYWQCYLAGETNYLVGVNGLIINDPEASPEMRKKREIKELRLYDVSKIPGFIKKCGAEQGFRPWTKETLENRLYKSLCVIYDKVIDTPVGTEFMFVKYNEFDPPVHDVDGSITGPYLLAFRQLIIQGVPTPSQPNLVINLMKNSKYAECVQWIEDRKFTCEDIPKAEEKENCLILTFKNEVLAELFLHRVGGYLIYLKENDKFPAGLGIENLEIKKVFMKKPVAPHGNNTQSWRSSNREWNNDTIGDNKQSWRNANHQQQHSSPRSNDNGWRRVDSAGNNSQSWRSSNQPQQQFNSWNNNRRREDTPSDGTQSWRSSNHQQEQPNPRNIDGERGQHYMRRTYAPSSKSDSNWRQNRD